MWTESDDTMLTFVSLKGDVLSNMVNDIPCREYSLPILTVPNIPHPGPLTYSLTHSIRTNWSCNIHSLTSLTPRRDTHHIWCYILHMSIYVCTYMWKQWRKQSLFVRETYFQSIDLPLHLWFNLSKKDSISNGTKKKQRKPEAKVTEINGFCCLSRTLYNTTFSECVHWDGRKKERKSHSALQLTKIHLAFDKPRQRRMNE